MSIQYRLIMKVKKQYISVYDKLDFNLKKDIVHDEHLKGYDFIAAMPASFMRNNRHMRIYYVDLKK